MNKELALTSLGYRKLGKDRMMKPIGFSCLIYFLETDRIGSFFMSFNKEKKLTCWTTQDIRKSHEKQFKEAIAYFEAYKHKNAGYYTDFSFLTKEEYWDNIL